MFKFFEDFFKSLFGEVKRTPGIMEKMAEERRIRESKEPDPYDGFSVEYYPESGFYIPKYGSFYLRTRWPTGMVEKLGPSFFTWAETFQDEKSAWEFIDKFKEHQLKSGVVVIKKPSA